MPANGGGRRPVPGRREQAPLAADRQRAAYVAAAAHDMKDHLAVIRGMAQLLERNIRRTNAAEPAAILAGLATIQGGTHKLQRLVDEFLDLSRVQSDEPVQFNRQPTDLVAVARACVDEFAGAADHRLTLATAEETAVGHWDAARLDRVIANLLSNAIKFSAPTGAVCMTLAVDRGDGGDDAVLVVQDGGVGIPAADVPCIFAPFFRAGNVAGTTVGTGLGLYGARAIVEQLGGTLRLESTEGVGTTVTLRLPLAPRASPNPSAPPQMITPVPTS